MVEVTTYKSCEELRKTTTCKSLKELRIVAILNKVTYGRTGTEWIKGKKLRGPSKSYGKRIEQRQILETWHNYGRSYGEPRLVC